MGMNCHLCHKPTALTEKELAGMGAKKVACSDCALILAEQDKLAKEWKDWKKEK